MQLNLVAAAYAFDVNEAPALPRGARLATLPSAEMVDGEWYVETYPDVRAAIMNGQFKSAVQHYLAYGFQEGRLPSSPKVDEAWYLATYPDVAQAILDGKVKNGTDHFIHYGYIEGRFPRSRS
jgi:hypothetical protein